MIQQLEIDPPSVIHTPPPYSAPLSRMMQRLIRPREFSYSTTPPPAPLVAVLPSIVQSSTSELVASLATKMPAPPAAQFPVTRQSRTVAARTSMIPPP